MPNPAKVVKQLMHIKMSAETFQAESWRPLKSAHCCNGTISGGEGRIMTVVPMSELL